MLKSRILMVWAALSVLVVLFDCNEGQAAEEAAKPASQSGEAKTEAKPKISFEKMVYDFGEVGPRTKNTCEFKFTNTGQALLKIGEVRATCGCTVFSLAKKDYAPGETGTLKLTYTAGTVTGTSRKYVYVPSNDEANAEVKLTIQAKVVLQVEATPEKLELLPRKKNAGLPDIVLKSRDGRPFSIKGFKSTKNSVTADFDPNVGAAEFVLHPKADINKLKAGNRGSIEVQVTHPECPSVRISYTVLADFRTNPEYIRLLPAKAGEVVTKEIMVISNYDEDFEVESTSSKNGHVKVLRQEKEGKAYKFTVQIAPPVVDKHLYFSDTFYVNIKDRDKLAINCVGYYLKQDVVSKKAKGDAAEFKAEPAVLDVYGTQPGKPVIREVWVSARNNKDFEIGTTSSRKGIVRLLGREKRGPRYKLRLQITPPATEQTLKNFSDVFYVNIVGGDKREPTKLSITCRGSYSQRPKKG